MILATMVAAVAVLVTVVVVVFREIMIVSVRKDRRGRIRTPQAPSFDVEARLQGEKKPHRNSLSSQRSRHCRRRLDPLHDQQKAGGCGELERQMAKQMFRHAFSCRFCVSQQEAWKLDARSKEDVGLAVEIDPDGKAATLDSESLTGYGVSKPLRIGAQVGSLSSSSGFRKETENRPALFSLGLIRSRRLFLSLNSWFWRAFQRLAKVKCVGNSSHFSATTFHVSGNDDDGGSSVLGSFLRRI